MQYLLQNKVNYLPNVLTSLTLANNRITTTSTAGAIGYINNNNNVYYNHTAFIRINMPTQENTSSFQIYTLSGATYLANVVIVNLKPSFTCSNIIEMTSNESVTYTVKITTPDSTITKEYTYPLKKQFMNTPICTNVINVHNKVSRVELTATSTLPLTLLRSKNFTPLGTNGELLIK